MTREEIIAQSLKVSTDESPKKRLACVIPKSKALLVVESGKICKKEYPDDDIPEYEKEIDYFVYDISSRFTKLSGTMLGAALTSDDIVNPNKKFGSITDGTVMVYIEHFQIHKENIAHYIPDILSDMMLDIKEISDYRIESEKRSYWTTFYPDIIVLS